MARPSRNNADYFTHNADLRNDRRIKAIRGRFGPAGYGLVLMLLEVLTDADHTQLSTEELEMELLAGDFGVSVTEINSLLQLAEKIGFFARNEAGFLICPDLNKALEQVFEKRNRSRIVAQEARERQSVSEIAVSVTGTPQSKVKESKGKEKNKEKTAAPTDLTFPSHWTEVMVKAYRDEWLPFRQAQKKRLQPVSIQKQIDSLSHLNESSLLKCLNSSISNGYLGVFPENFLKPLSISLAHTTPTTNRPLPSREFV